MSIRFNGDFSTANFTQYSAGETDLNALGAVVEDVGDDFDSSHFYQVSHDGVSGREAFVTEETEFSHQAKSIRGRFRFRMDDTNIFNSARTLRILDCEGAGSLEFSLALTSIPGGEITQLEVRYRDSGASSVQELRNLPHAILDNTVHLIEFHFVTSNTAEANSGIARVWLDGAEVGVGVGLDVGYTRYMNKLKFGVCSTNVTVSRVIDFADLKLSTNATDRKSNV